MSDEIPIEIEGEEKSREELERDADRVRARLMTTLDVLDRRRHDLLDVKKQVEEHAAPLIGVAAFAVLIVGGAVGVAIHNAIERRRHRNRDRFRALARLWRNPERAVRTQERSFFGEIGRKVMMTALSALATQVTSHLVKHSLAMEEGHEGEHAGERPLPHLVRLAEERLRPKPDVYP